MKKNRLLIIASSVIALYAILGFLILPLILQSQLEKQINQRIIPTATIEKIEFNPFLFKFTIHNLALAEKEKRLIEFKRLYVDFSLIKSLEKQHIHFKKVELNQPTVNLNILKDGTINLAKLLKPETTQKEKTEPTPNNTPVIAFKVAKTVLDNATINIKIDSENSSENFSINNLSYVFYDLGTYNQTLASHKLRLQINKHTQLNIDGGFQLEPLKMYGNLSLKNLQSQDFVGLKKEMLNFTPSNAIIDLNFGFQVTNKNALKIKIDNGNFLIKEFNITQKKKQIAGFKQFEINNISLLYPEQKITLDSINLNNPFAQVEMLPNGQINLANLIKSNPSKNSKKEVNIQENDSKIWDLSINKLNINNLDSTYSNAKEKQKLALKNTNIHLETIKNSGEKSNINAIKIGSNLISFKDKQNTISIKPLSIKLNNLSVDKSDITIPNIDLNSGSISLKEKKSNTKIVTKKLAVSLQKLSKKENKIHLKRVLLNQPLTILNNKEIQIIAKRLNININDIVNTQSKLAVKSSSINRPQISIVVKKKPKEISKETQKAQTVVAKKSAKTSDNKKIKMDIGPIKIKNAQLIFEDKNLPIPFKTNITKLNGDFSSFKSSSSQPTDLKIEGQVDKYGYTKITGLVDPENIKNLTDVNMIFKNIAIKNFTPYSGKFVGRELEAGKLDLNLNYNIKRSNLNATNSIIITDIKLGKKVESSDALSLPLELGIALMEDSNGVIDLELPITGDLDSPQFSVAPIVWKAFTNLIIKAVTSPFSFLASLLGIEADEIKSIDFPFGKKELIASEKEVLDNLAKVFQKRPNIALKIKPAYHIMTDKNALQLEKLNLLVQEEQKKIKDKEDTYLTALENIYNSYEKMTALEEVKKGFQDKKKKELLVDDYVQHLKNSLVEKQSITKEQLKSLSQQRVQEIVNYVTTQHNIKKERLVIDEKTQEMSDKKLKWVPYNLEVSVKK